MTDFDVPSGGFSAADAARKIILEVENKLHRNASSHPSHCDGRDNFADIDAATLAERVNNLVQAIQSDPAYVDPITFEDRVDKYVEATQNNLSQLDQLEPYAGLSESWSREIVSCNSLGRVMPMVSASQPSASALHSFEIFGSIKWFDLAKGFGFVVPDNGLPDVLLHVSQLRSVGYQTALEGARVHAIIVRSAKGLQVVSLLSMDESTAIRPSELPQRTHVVVEPESDWERATVKWFNFVRGFGFLTRGEGTSDIFVHMETLRRFGFSELRPGQAVMVRWGHGSKGVMAAELRPEGAAIPRTI